jgi:hypothetical protein
MAAVGVSPQNQFGSANLRFRWEGPTIWEGPEVRPGERHYVQVGQIGVGGWVVVIEKNKDPNTPYSFRSGFTKLERLRGTIEAINALKPYAIICKYNATEPRTTVKGTWQTTRESALVMEKMIPLAMPADGLKKDGSYCLVVRSTVVPSSEDAALMDLSLKAELEEEQVPG